MDCQICKTLSDEFVEQSQSPKLCCTACKNWFHRTCLGTNKKELETGETWFCPTCKPKVSKVNNSSTLVQYPEKQVPFYKCQFCEKFFAMAVDLKNHKDTFHHEQFLCNECLAPFSSKLHLMKHITLNHSLEIPNSETMTNGTSKPTNGNMNGREEKSEVDLFQKLTCPHCGLMFATISDVTEHVKSRHVCDICKKIFPVPKELDAHIYQHHKQAISKVPSEIEKVPKSPSNGNLKTQQPILSYIEPSIKNPTAICNFCDKTFANKGTLDRHIRTIHFQIKKKCKQCPMTFQSKVSLKKHWNRYHENKSTSSQSGMEVDMSDQNKVSQTKADDTKHQIKSSEKFPTIIKHLKKNPSKHIKRNSVGSKQKQESLHCKVCGLSFGDLKSLVTHTQNVHLKALLEGGPKKVSNSESNASTSTLFSRLFPKPNTKSDLPFLPKLPIRKTSTDTKDFQTTNGDHSNDNSKLILEKEDEKVNTKPDFIDNMKLTSKIQELNQQSNEDGDDEVQIIKESLIEIYRHKSQRNCVIFHDTMPNIWYSESEEGQKFIKYYQNVNFDLLIEDGSLIKVGQMIKGLKLKDEQKPSTDIKQQDEEQNMDHVDSEKEKPKENMASVNDLLEDYSQHTEETMSNGNDSSKVNHSNQDESGVESTSKKALEVQQNGEELKISNDDHSNGDSEPRSENQVKTSNVLPKVTSGDIQTNDLFKLFMCGLCFVTFNDAKSLESHNAKLHSPRSKKRIPCPKCNKMFGSIKGLAGHSKVHTQSKSNKVKEDATISTDKSNSIVDQESNVNSDETSQNNLQIDATKFNQSHSNQYPLTPNQVHCIQCNLKFSKSRDLKIHITNVHSRQLIPKINGCSSVASPKSSKPIEATININKFQGDLQVLATNIPQQETQKGMNSQDQNNPVKTPIQSPSLQPETQVAHSVTNELMKCYPCGKTFTKKVNLKNHQITFHPEGIPECDICDESFENVADLAKHVITKHHLTKKFVCQVCELHFSNPMDLFNHEYSLHNIELTTKRIGLTEVTQRIGLTEIVGGKFYCQLCNKFYYDRSYLKRHINFHHLIVRQQFKCKLCAKKFGKPSQLKVHLQLHDKTLSCKLCDMEYSQISGLLRHAKIVHGGYIFKCELCNKNFLRSEMLKKHFFVTHKYRTIKMRKHKNGCSYANLKSIATKENLELKINDGKINSALVKEIVDHAVKVSLSDVPAQSVKESNSLQNKSQLPEIEVDSQADMSVEVEKNGEENLSNNDHAMDMSQDQLQEENESESVSINPEVNSNPTKETTNLSLDVLQKQKQNYIQNGTIPATSTASNELQLVKDPEATVPADMPKITNVTSISGKDSPAKHSCTFCYEVFGHFPDFDTMHSNGCYFP